MAWRRRHRNQRFKHPVSCASTVVGSRARRQIEAVRGEGFYEHFPECVEQIRSPAQNMLRGVGQLMLLSELMFAACQQVSLLRLLPCIDVLPASCERGAEEARDESGMSPEMGRRGRRRTEERIRGDRGGYREPNRLGFCSSFSVNHVQGNERSITQGST